MNILNLVFSFTTGGIENLLVDTMNRWDPQIGTMSLCIINDDLNPDLVSRIRNQENVIILNRPKGGSKVPFMRALQKEIKTRQIDLVHCHSIAAMKFLALSTPFGFHSYKKVLTIHNVRLVPDFSGLENLVLRHYTNKVFGVSKAVVEEIQKVLTNKEAYSLMYNGVDASRFELDKNAPEDDAIRITNVARLVPQMKGQDLLIKAIGELVETYPDIICRFAGEPPQGKEINLKTLEDQVADLGLENHVKFIGNCNDIPGLLRDTDIFVLPSRYEGFGIAVIEAILARCDVIASDLDGPREILEGGTMGRLIEPGSVEDLMKAIAAAIDNPSKNKDKAKEHCLNLFGIEGYLETLSTAYKEVVT